MTALRRLAARPRSAAPALAPLLALVPALVLALACAGCSAHKPATVPTPEPTPLARLNTAAMALPRIRFCTLVPATAVRDALGGRSGRLERWGDGDQTDVGIGGRQVVAEHGCAWSASSATARAWSYAPPVTPALAGAVIAASQQEPHCRDITGPAFGSPSVTQVCTQGRTRRVRHAGLFGDTWFSCEVADDASPQAVEHRSAAWCVEVANVLNTTR